MKKKFVLGLSFLCVAIIAFAATHFSMNKIGGVQNDTITVDEMPSKPQKDKKQETKDAELQTENATSFTISENSAPLETATEETTIATEPEAVPASKGKSVQDGDDIPMKNFTLQVNGKSKVFNVADVNDNSHIYGECINKKNTWIVISKKEFRLYVYEAVASDTLLRATFPVCYARNAPDKTKTGDSCTPESKNEKSPFTISQIQDASSWRHTFKNDPRGNILAYGPYFMRLKLTGSKVPGNSSIGIHGCGGNEGKSNSYSVPGRDSEGCIRLRDADLKTLRNSYCEVGTKVYIKSATGVAGNRYGYEKKAIVALGNKFVPAVYGNPLSNKTKNL